VLMASEKIRRNLNITIENILLVLIYHELRCASPMMILPTR